MAECYALRAEQATAAGADVPSTPIEVGSLHGRMGARFRFPAAKATTAHIIRITLDLRAGRCRHRRT